VTTPKGNCPRIAQPEDGSKLIRPTLGLHPKAGTVVKFFHSFTLRPWKVSRKALDKTQRETERQGLAVDAQLALLKSDEERSDTHWRLLKKKGPRRS
jgi:hypothetical protein